MNIFDCNETKAMFMDDEAALADRADFVHNVGTLASQTRQGVISMPLGYQALFNFIIGNRGGGKTYGAKKHVIKRFLKTGEQFIYLRRYKQELKKIKTFFADIAAEFPDVEFKVKGNNFFINGKLAGYAVPLSTSKIEKSVSYPDVTIDYLPETENETELAVINFKGGAKKVYQYKM